MKSEIATVVKDVVNMNGEKVATLEGVQQRVSDGVHSSSIVQWSDGSITSGIHKCCSCQG